AHRPLGVVRRISTAGWRFWRRGERLEVLETEDEALLFTIYRPGWLSVVWSFYDSEEHCLGRWTGPQVLNAGGEFLARTQARDGGLELVDQHGFRLANFEPREGANWRLQFVEGQVHSPFTRMAFLGSVLAWGETTR